MFSSASDSAKATSLLARGEVKVWEKSLSLRISLQKVTDVTNKLPGVLDPADESVEELQKRCKSLSYDLAQLLDSQIKSQTGDASIKKRKFDDIDSFSWNSLSSQQSALKPQWEEVIERWHSRLNFGSFDAVSKMKSFKQSIWEQVETALQDSDRELEKSRMPLEDSRRLFGEQASSEESIYETTDGKKVNLEVYDDRQFYSTLLKTFVSQSASSGSSSAIHADDLDALKQFKKAKSDVDRKASKGRRIRYTVHAKLQSYMFPRPGEPPEINTEKLLQSLFQ